MNLLWLSIFDDEATKELIFEFPQIPEP